MQLLLLVAIPLLGTVKVLFQGKSVKGYVESLRDSLTLGSVTFATIAVCLAAIYLRGVPSQTTLWLGVLLGVCNVTFQVCYNVAMIKGPVSLTGVCANFSIVVPLAVGFTVLGEQLTVAKGVGIVLIFVAFVLLQRKTDDKKVNVVWLLLTVATMLAAGVSNVVMSVFKTLPVAEERNLLIVVSNIVAAVVSILCAVICGAAKRTSGEQLLKPMCRGSLLFCNGVGLDAGGVSAAYHVCPYNGRCVGVLPRYGRVGGNFPYADGHTGVQRKADGKADNRRVYGRMRDSAAQFAECVTQRLTTS